MQKKLMALAVAGALSAPVAAFAQASNVQIYGRANVGLDNYQAERKSHNNYRSDRFNDFVHGIPSAFHRGQRT